MAAVAEINLKDFTDKLRGLPDAVSVEVKMKAARAAGEIFRAEIEANTPTGRTYTYQYNGRTVTVKDPHPGQARASVIIYERKPGRRDIYQDVTSVLVGYEKRKAYYAYFFEYGSSKQAAKPVVRPAFDSKVAEALAVAESVIREAMEQALREIAA